jgi:DNA-binding sugar fermentation-stimulating protein
MSKSLLMKLDELIEGKIVKRPSKHIKTPYVADILCNGEEVLGHTPALGCCGLSDVNSIVLVANSTNKTNKCSHTVYLSMLNEQIIGIHPKLAETLTESALNKNMLTRLQNIRQYRRETVIHIKDIVDSRFDFTGIDKDGIPFIMEVKNVPLADYEDVSAKERKKMDFTDRDCNSKVAYFPDGYRKKSSDTVSPRALKHIQELTTIKKYSKIRCIMCYVIQRTDVNRFTPSVIDPEYRAAFKSAIEVGVEIITMVVSWNKDGEAYFIRDDLPFCI